MSEAPIISLCVERSQCPCRACCQERLANCHGSAEETLRLEVEALREELRKESERLDWLEKVGFSTVQTAGTGPEDAPGVHSWRDLQRDLQWGWTAHWISSEFTTAREAIDAAMLRSAGKV